MIIDSKFQVPSEIFDLTGDKYGVDWDIARFEKVDGMVQLNDPQNPYTARRLSKRRKEGEQMLSGVRSYSTESDPL